MTTLSLGGRWGMSLAAAATMLFSACATAPIASTPVSSSRATQSEDDDLGQLIAQMRADLHRSQMHEQERSPAEATANASVRARDREFAARANELFAPLNLVIHQPVVGIEPSDLTDSWGEPRDGGTRPHRGIDIFARRGTSVVAVEDGVITYIGTTPKAGQCLWLTTEHGLSYFYAHLERWAPGIYEGMEVRTGELLGFVGNTGNAIHTPPHLHFAVSRNDETVNPYPILTHAIPVQRASAPSELSGGFGTR